MFKKFIGTHLRLVSMCVMGALTSCSYLHAQDGKHMSEPKSALIYCSYSESSPAGGGKNFCELIADVGTQPKIVVSLNNDCHFAEHVKKEFPVDSTTVSTLQQMLKEQKVYKLNGYFKEEPMTGGTTYRIYMEYADGQTVNAWWYSHSPSEEVVAAYNMIERFFRPWRQQVNTD